MRAIFVNEIMEILKTNRPIVECDRLQLEMNKEYLLHRLKEGLLEDSAFNDVTTSLLPNPKKEIIHGRLVAKQDGIFCGAFLIRPLFTLLDKRVRIKLRKKDGGRVKKGETIAVITTNTAALLAGERLFLNLACWLSGISTLTHRYVEAVKGTEATILDTRKTTPLWRDLEKYAVRCGGAKNHRMSLGDAVLIKDNHLKHLRQHGRRPSEIFSPQAIRRLPRKPDFVLFEATTIKDVWEGIKARVDVVMFDNMTLSQMKQAMILIRAARKALNSDHPQIEVSGGVTISMAKKMAGLGVERISVGALTHSAAALDLSLEVD